MIMPQTRDKPRSVVAGLLLELAAARLIETA
jgi:hypothetical protein